MKIKHIAFALLMFPLSAYSASFDCEKARTFIEQAICNNYELSTLDDSLSVAYNRALFRVFNSQQLKINQKNWLKNTRNRCTDESCLKRVYIKRIDFLDSL